MSDVVSVFVGKLSGARQTTRGWEAKCPAHDDQKPSLGVSRGEDGRVLLHCQAGCKTDDIVAAVGLKLADLFPPREGGQVIGATYDYRDEAGQLLYQVVRFVPKDFRQRRPGPAGGWEWSIKGARRVLYRLAELLASPFEDPVFVVEGEKDAEALAAMGLTATTNVGGAGKWRPEYTACLKGRHVVILPDNDDAGRTHGQAVAEALAPVAASVRVVNLPGLPAKGDVSDWLKAGGTKEALLAEWQPPARALFMSSADRMSGESVDRGELGRDVLSFGVGYLDDALGGITSRDLVLVGAKSGVGKTALATMAALHNIECGRRVHYFALEAEDREIERRMKFQVAANLYFADRSKSFDAPVDIRYLDWYLGRLERTMGPYDRQADELLREKMRRLYTFYRLDSFTGEDFCNRLEEIKGETDLVILDHLHYVDTTDENENRGYKRTVKLIRDAVLRANKPVIVVAHVRKSDRRNEALIPTQEDFHGSSDVPKIATKAVMLAPARDQPRPRSYLWPTYMQVVKCRLDSTLTHYAALLNFNLRENRYESHYELGKLGEGGAVFNRLSEDERPGWAKRERKP